MPTHRSDQELIAAANRGDYDAFEELYRRYRSMATSPQFKSINNSTIPMIRKSKLSMFFRFPKTAPINEFLMIIGERQIRGIIRERKEAEEIYQEARSQGYVTSLLTQERPNIFTQSVANIEPGKQINVQIKYYNTLSYMDGWFEFVFPMVVGPRFNPSAKSASPNVPYLEPHERSGHDISLRVDLNAGVSIEDFESPTHKIKSERPSANRLIATLPKSDRVPNKDFVLRYRVTGDQIKAGLLTHKDERGGFFSLMLYPPAHRRRAASSHGNGFRARLLREHERSAHRTGQGRHSRWPQTS